MVWLVCSSNHHFECLCRSDLIGDSVSVSLAGASCAMSLSSIVQWVVVAYQVIETVLVRPQWVVVAYQIF